MVCAGTAGMARAGGSAMVIVNGSLSAPPSSVTQTVPW